VNLYTRNREHYTIQKEPRTENREPRTKNQEPRTKNQEPRTKNQEPRTKNQEPRTKNQEQTDCSRTGYPARFVLRFFHSMFSVVAPDGSEPARMYLAGSHPSRSAAGNSRACQGTQVCKAACPVVSFGRTYRRVAQLAEQRSGIRILRIQALHGKIDVCQCQRKSVRSVSTVISLPCVQPRNFVAIVVRQS
jgi:hypothetical protein